MRKRFFSVLLTIALILALGQVAYATTSGAALESTGGVDVEEGQTEIRGTTTDKKVEFAGEVSTAKIISAIVPTRVTFLVSKTNEGWNKITSPDFRIENLSPDTTLSVSLANAAITSGNGVTFASGASFDSYATSGAIRFNSYAGNRQLALAVAPKDSYTNWNELDYYVLRDNYYEYGYYYPRTLTYALAPGKEATYNVYGDVSSGFGNGETFYVDVTFRVTAQ